jgi:hypothetical protein
MLLSKMMRSRVRKILSVLLAKRLGRHRPGFAG